MKLQSKQKQNKIIQDKRKVMLEKLFNKLESSEDRALLLLLIQSYKDEIADLNYG
jgi:hypothetical protein